MMPHTRIDAALEKPRVRVALWVVGCVAAVALVIGMIVAVSSIYELSSAVRETQVANTAKVAEDRERAKRTAETAENAARAAERIEDCTTPGLPCFQDSQKRLRETVGSINDYALAAAYCQDKRGASTIPQLEACIRDTVEEIVDERRLQAGDAGEE